MRFYFIVFFLCFSFFIYAETPTPTITVTPTPTPVYFEMINVTNSMASYIYNYKIYYYFYTSISAMDWLFEYTDSRYNTIGVKQVLEMDAEQVDYLGNSLSAEIRQKYGLNQ